MAATPTGQVRGAVRVDDKPLAGALVTAVHAFSPSREALQKPAYTVSKADGSFVFDGLAAGSYRFCVQVAGSDLLDPCHWSSAPPLVNLAQGQKFGDLAITVKRGTVVQVRLDDDGGLMSNRQQSGKPLGLVVGVWAPGGRFHPATAMVDDSRGRTYGLVVPVDTSLNLVVRSQNVQMNDSHGQAVSAQAAPQQFRVSRGGTPPVFRFQVSGVGP